MCINFIQLLTDTQRINYIQQMSFLNILKPYFIHIIQFIIYINILIMIPKIMMIKYLSRFNHSHIPRNRNFFEITPIYPTNQSDYKLHGFRKEKIFSFQVRTQNLYRSVERNKWINRKLGKSNKKMYNAVQKILVDAESKLPYGFGFDDYISIFKNKKTQKINVAYIDTVVDIINKFKFKSEPQLVRFFRLGVADMQKDQIKEKLRGTIIKNVVLQALKIKSQRKYWKYLKNADQIKADPSAVPEIDQKLLQNDAFLKALRQIDQKIQIAERKLNIHSRYSLRKDQYNLYFKKPDQIQIKFPKYADVKMERVPTVVQNVNSSLQHPQKFQDYFIQQRIRRFYFLKKAESKLEGFNNIDKNRKYLKQLDIIGYDHIIDKLAYEYRLQQIVPQSTILDVYRQVDLLIDNLKVSTKIEQPRDIHLQQIFNRVKNPKDLLWEKMDIEKIFSPPKQQKMHLHSNIKEGRKYNLLTPQYSQSKQAKVSPNHDLQASLNHVPFNLYKHSQFEVFGIFGNERMPLSQPSVQQLKKDNFPLFKFRQKKLKPKPPPTPDDTRRQFHGYGKRKSSQAICRIRPGIGVVNINKVNIRDYFVDPYLRALTLQPLVATGTVGNWDVDIHVGGSGIMAQTASSALALSRALYDFNPKFKQILRRFGLVTDDRRLKQRKRIGKYKARKGYVYVRR